MKRILRRMIMPESEIRMDGESGKITGYAAVFDKPTELWSGFQEVVRPGAFAKTIRESDVRALFNHDPNFVLGRNTAGTLRLWEDTKGLGYEIEPPDTEFAKGLVESLRRGDISQSSFGFWVVKERRTEDNAAGVTTRELLEVELQDVSPVTFPAYEDTQAMVRSAREEMGVDLIAEGGSAPRSDLTSQSDLTPQPPLPPGEGEERSGALEAVKSLAYGMYCREMMARRAMLRVN